MEAKDFQALVEQLGELSTEQRDALVEAVRRKSSVNDAIRMIETRFAAAPRCGHCHSEKVATWAKTNPLTRYKCKACGKTFNALTGTPLAHLHRRDAWLKYAQALADGAFAQAAEARADIPEGARRDVTLYADEFQHFATSSFVGILSEARKFRLSLVLGTNSSGNSRSFFVKA